MRGGGGTPGLGGAGGPGTPSLCVVPMREPPSGPAVGQGSLPVRSAVGQGPASGAPAGQGPSFSTSVGQGPRPLPASLGQGPSLCAAPRGRTLSPAPRWGRALLPVHCPGWQGPSFPLCRSVGQGPSPGAPVGQGNPLLSTHHGRQAALPLGPTVRRGAGTSAGKWSKACPCCLPMPDRLGEPLHGVPLG